MRQDQAETIALQAFSWLTAQEDLAGRFLGESGASPADLAHLAHQPEFLGAVLDFILMQDDWVLAASENLGMRPETLIAVRASLPGGAVPDWT